MNSRIMTSEKAEKILAALKKRDRQNRKYWVPFQGPEDWDFAVLNAPKKGLEEGRDERPEMNNRSGCYESSTTRPWIRWDRLEENWG